MDEAQLRGALDALLARDLDFMVHFGVPENHHFVYRRAARAAAPNQDFERRCERYRDFARPWDGVELAGVAISQLLAVEPPGRASHYEALARELSHLNVVLTTSPLDHRSRWIEIFPPAASKSLASEWIRERHAVAREAVVAVGNDYNDRDLLDWAGRAHVVANAPPALRARYAVVASHDRGGFAEAVADL
jgi:hydroxymethylpyrimidine pyrophosphatase-like HAD family hydrolase